MCWAMYLFTDKKLEEIQYNYDNPSMYIKNIMYASDGYINLSKWNANKRNIYYLGSSEGCGCGWRNPCCRTESLDDEIKYCFNEINNLKNKFLDINIENIRKELSENNIKCSENEIHEIIHSRKNMCEDKIKNYEDDIKKLNENIKDRNDLYKLFKTTNFDGSYIIICWEGDQGEEIEETIKLDIEKIKDVNYEFCELVKYIL
jgi:phage-related protein